MNTEKYDVIVIGSGPAGGVVARKCNKAGLKVAVVEQNGWGGVCPLRGCEPKKTLADTSHAVSRIRDMAGHGASGDTHIDWPALMQFKRSLIDPIPDAILESFEDNGIKAISGEARLDGDGTISVAGYGELKGKNIVLATGAQPRKLETDGADLVMTSEQFLEMDTMPQSIIFLGGGFISFEFAGIAAAAGAKTTILHRSARVLKGFDVDLSRTLVQSMEAAGTKVHVNHPVVGVESTSSGIRVTTRRADDDKEESFEAEKAVLGIGRVPSIEGLGLEAAGIETTSNGVKVNASMQSVSNPQVYAIGDCAEPGLPLTMTAALQAEVAAKNIIGKDSAVSDLTGSASVVFTHPPLAAVGLSEEEARDQDREIILHSGDAGKWSEHKRIGLAHAGYKIIEDAESGRILGAHYLGQHAEEVINVFGLAIRHGLTREDLLAHPWSYPSFGYALRYMLN